MPNLALANNENTINVQANDFRLYLSDYLSSYHNTSAAHLDLKGAKELYQLGKFAKLEDSSLQFGYTQEVLWLTAKIENSTSAQITSNIEVRYAPLDYIDIYLVDAQEKLIAQVNLGDHIPYSAKPVKSRNHIGQLTFEANSQYQVFIRIKTDSSMSIPLYLSSNDALYEYEHYVNIIIGMFYGLSIGLFFYNLFLFYIIRDTVYLYYIIYVLGYTLFMASIDGLLFQFWPNSIDWESRAINIFPWTCGVFLSMFCREILQTKKESPNSDSILRAFFYLYTIGTISFFFIDISIAARLNAPIVAINAFCILGITLVRYFQGCVSAKYFIIGMGGFCFGLITVSGGALNLLGNYDLAPTILKAAASIELIMFSIALAQRIGALESEHLRKMDKLKDDFLAKTSHELRTPLNGIIGIADSMLDRRDKNWSEQDHRNLSLISSSGYRLANLVNDILDFSKLKQSDIYLVRQPINLYQMANIVIELSRPLIQHKQLNLINQIDANNCTVSADQDRIYQVLHNLISNAIKFTDQGSVTFSSKPVKKGLQISVSDTGKGIPKDKLKIIFQSFEQAHSSANKGSGGTGLGLAITSQLVRLHEGEIWAEPEPDQGATLVFTLPQLLPTTESGKTDSRFLSRTSSNLSRFGQERRLTESQLNLVDEQRNQALSDNAINTELTEPHSENTHNLLIVDDESINIEVLKNQLAPHGYALTFAHRGEEAIALIEQGNSFDLVLLDIMMPGISGYETCRYIREKFSQDQLPVIMVTAKNQIEDLVTAFKAGANDYLTKPFLKDELLARIDLNIKLKKTIQSLSDSEQKYRSIYNEALEGIFQVTREGKVTGNPAFAKILGYEDSNDVTQSIVDGGRGIFFDTKKFDDFATDLKSKGTITHFETKLKRKDGSLIWGSIKINRILDTESRLIRIEGLLDDVTIKKQAEHALKRSYEEIEAQVHERTKELQATNQQLETAINQAENANYELVNFASIIGHELLTPFSVLRCEIELIVQGIRKPEISALNSLLEQIDHFSILIDDLSDLALTDERNFSYDKSDCSLHKILNRELALFERQLQQQKITVSSDIEILAGLIVHADPNRIIQVFDNILKNSLRYTNAGGNMSVTAEVENDCVKIHFEDSAPGVDEQEIGKLFNRFYRVEQSRSRATGGIGLGLSICKKIIESHNGNISASSSPLGGITISLELPLR